MEPSREYSESKQTREHPQNPMFSSQSVRFILRTLLRLGVSQHDIEDLAQDVLVIAHRKQSSFDPLRPHQPWLYGISKNVARDHFKKARHRFEAPFECDASKPFPTPPERKLDVVLLRNALAQLPPPIRDTVMFCDLMELTMKEAAVELDIPLGTLKDRLARGRQRLIKQLKPKQNTIPKGGLS